MKTIVRYALLTFALIAVPTLGLAHGNDQHVLGTVTAIDATHVDVKTPKGASVTVQLTDQTKFIPKGIKRAGGQPQVGDRVVIDVNTEGAVMTATEVQYSNPKPKTP
ncbi:DUF5666 domain-containing protein [Nitrospira sp. Nam80]